MNKQERSFKTPEEKMALASLLVNSSPERMIELMGEMGHDFSDFDSNLAHELAKKKHEVTDKDIQAIDFLFWFSYCVERSAESLIIDPEVHIGARKEVMESIVKKLHFGGKIKVIEEIYLKKKDPMIKIMRKVQDLRNHLAHGRLEELNYGGYHLSDKRAQILLTGHLKDSYLESGDK